MVVDLRQTSDAIILCIADDGHGMRARSAGRTAGKGSLGVGIPGMRARLRQLGGTLRIETGAGGTRVVATVPLQVLACEIAAARGNDVDQPRNLAKSVTVE